MPVSGGYIACGDAKTQWRGMHVTFRILSPPSSAPRHHLLNSYRILHINALQFLIIPYISIPSPISSLIESSSAVMSETKLFPGYYF